MSNVLLLYTAFLEAGQRNESYNVLNQLLSNSVNENRFNDAAYYSWLLANYFNQLSADEEKTVAVNGTEGHKNLRSKADSLYRQADIYYTYYPIFKYIVSIFYHYLCPLFKTNMFYL